MKRSPHAEWDPLGVQTQPAMRAHNIICVHTMVGYLTSTRTMFKQNGYSGTESHYGVGGIWGGDKDKDWDGKAFQWQSRAYTADANLKGNPYIISIETADNAPAKASDILAWTPKQVEKIAQIIAWECSLSAHSECPTDWTCRKGVEWNGIRVAIPPVLVADSKPGRRGIGYHRQGIDPWRVSGGDSWSTARGKECPGDRRIAQLKTQVIPMVQQILKGEDMATAAEVWNYDGIEPPKREADPVANPKWQPDSYLRHTLDAVDAVAKDVNDALAQVEDNRDRLIDLSARMDGLDVLAVTQAIAGAGDIAANAVRAAGEELLAKLDAIRVDINRG